MGTFLKCFNGPSQARIRNLAPVEGGERALRTIYLPAFQKGCVEAGALSIMTAYSSYDGVPVVASSIWPSIRMRHHPAYASPTHAVAEILVREREQLGDVIVVEKYPPCNLRS